jgi:hypothetical protein
MDRGTHAALYRTNVPEADSMRTDGRIEDLVRAFKVLPKATPGRSVRHACPTSAIVSVGHHSPDGHPASSPRRSLAHRHQHRQATATDCLMISDTHSAHSLIAPHKWSHNRPKPISPSRVLLLCIGRWWSDFRFISCGLLAHFWDPIAINELIPARFRGRTGFFALFLIQRSFRKNQPLVACVTQQPAEVAVSDSGSRSDVCLLRGAR